MFENLITNTEATHQKNLLPVLSLILLGGLDQVAVVTALFQLHHNIQETRCAASCPFGKSLIVSGQDPLVILLLQSRHLHPEDLFHFGRKGFLHILFDSPEEEGLQHLMETLVAILPPFPMVLFKIFPEFKPGNKTGQQLLQKQPGRGKKNFFFKL